MPVTKECRCCGLALTFPEGYEALDCPACGTRNERPRAEGIMLDNFRRAIRQQADRDFYNAEKSYQYVLNSCPDNAEALWGRLLCHYGAVYIGDGGRRRWELHTTRSKPLREQGDFRRACELAEPSVRAQYEADAAYIDGAMTCIRELAASCPPYDIFLCHKTKKPDGGGYTEDYNRAYSLYTLLTRQGYRVFFAPAEMEGIAAGENYEAGIYHALDTARVMLIICSDPAYLTSKWVQSEWQRYLEMVDADRRKHLIPLLYGGMTAGRMPQEFRSRSLQPLTMELNATKKLLQTVRRYVKPRRTMRRALLAAAVALMLMAGAWAAYQPGRETQPVSGGEMPAAAPTPTPTQKPTATPTLRPTATPTQKPTATPTPRPTATPTQKPTPTPTPRPTATPTQKPTATPTKRPTPTPTQKPTPTDYSFHSVYSCTIIADSARARAGAGTEYDVVGYVFRGESYTVLDMAFASNGKRWYQVIVDGRVSWISSGVAMLGEVTGMIVSGGSQGYAYPIGQNCMIIAESARVRAGAGTEYAVVGYVWEGESYTILDTASASNGRTWYQVRVEGVDGWISSGITNMN